MKKLAVLVLSALLVLTLVCPAAAEEPLPLLKDTYTVEDNQIICKGLPVSGQGTVTVTADGVELTAVTCSTRPASTRHSRTCTARSVGCAARMAQGSAVISAAAAAVTAAIHTVALTLFNAAPPSFPFRRTISVRAAIHGGNAFLRPPQNVTRAAGGIASEPAALACMEDREVDILANVGEKRRCDPSGGGFLPDRKIKITENYEVCMNE